MPKSPYSVLIATKDDGEDEAVRKAVRYCEANFEKVSVQRGNWGDPLPLDIQGFRGDILLSYMSRWVIPDYVLNNVQVAAINFHPASPEYPGIGCNNFALYEGATEFGATCHHMAPVVDTGDIIRVERFPIHESDDVESLMVRCYDYMLVMLYDVIDLLIAGKELPTSEEQWTRKPFTRKQLDELGRITTDMDPAEIERRIRATSYREWKPEVVVGQHRFKLM
ncbi:MAG: formyltransferase family protein [Phycisphaerales bacterium JB063]